MKRRLLKLLTLAVCVALLVGAFAGCKNTQDEPEASDSVKEQEANQKDSGQEPEQEDMSEIIVTAFRWETGMTVPPDDNYVGTKIFEATGVRFEWIVPPAEPQEKLNAYLASGEYPDIMEIKDASLLNNFIESGAILALNELIDQNAPNLKKNLGSLINKMKNEDGNLYHLPEWYRVDGKEDFPEHSYEIFCRTGIMKDMGWFMPETFADYETLLQYAADNTDMIPCMLPLAQEEYENTLYSLLGGAAGLKHSKELILTQDNKIDHMVKSDGFRAGLKQLNDWYLKGLISAESITMKKDLLEERFMAGEVFSSFYPDWHPDEILFQENLAAEGKDLEAMIQLYVKLDESVEKTTYVTYAVSYPTGYSLASTTEYGERIIKLVDFLNTRDGFLTLYGKNIVGGNKDSEGYNIYVDENGIFGITTWLEEQLETDENYALNEGLWFYGIFSPDTCNWATIPDIDMLAIEADVSQWRDDVTNEHYAALGYDGLAYWPVERENSINVTDIKGLPLDPDSDEYMKQIDIRDYISKTLPKLIVSESSTEFDALYDDMLSTIKGYGLDEVLAKYQELYEKRVANWN